MNKKLTKAFFVAFFVALCLSVCAQDKMFGYIRDRENLPIANVDVELVGFDEKVKSDKVGYFQFVDIPQGVYTVRYSHVAYNPAEQTIAFPNQQKGALGTTILANRNNTNYQVNFLDDFTVDNTQINYPNFAFFLQNRDLYSGNSTRNTRGYVSKYRGLTVGQHEIFINASSASTPNTRIYGYNAWNGLNELLQTSFTESHTRLIPNAAIGGNHLLVDNINHAYTQTKGYTISYARSNGLYRSKLFMNYNSGINKNGWAYSAALTSRSGSRNPLVEGAAMNAYSFYVGLSKVKDYNKFNLNMSYGLNNRGGFTPQNKVITGYLGKRYNPLWGHDEGELRNAEVKKSSIPLFQFSHTYTKEHWTWRNGLSYQSAVYRDSRLQWQQARNPMPDYYRNMPNFYFNFDENEKAENLKQEWLSNNSNITQINWGQLRTINQNQPITNYGLSSGQLAKYYVLDDLTKEKSINLTSTLRHAISEKTTVFANYSYQKYHSKQYAEVADLLDANFAPNANLQDATSSNNALYNKQEEKQGKKQGDMTEYHFCYNWNFHQLNPGFLYKSNRLDVMSQISIGHIKAQREGFFEPYSDPKALGKSQLFETFTMGFKTKIDYRLDGFNSLKINMAYLMQNPYLEDIFINPRFSNQITPNISLPISKSIELGYAYRKGNFSFRALGYLIDLENATELSQTQNNDLFFIKALNGNSNQNANYVTQLINNVNKRHVGVEIATNYRITNNLTASATANLGHYAYTNNPDVYVVANQQSSQQNSLGKAFLKGYKIGGDPQKHYSLGLAYRVRQSWNIGLTGIYLQDNYATISPVLRSNAFITNPRTGMLYDEVENKTLAQILKQEEFPYSFICNFNASYTMRLGNYSGTISLLVNNLLDNQNSVRYGQENQQFTNYRDYARDNTSNSPIFGSRYFYNLGRNFFINFAIKF